jgi:hypothetical protein
MLPAHQLLVALTNSVSIITEQQFSRGWNLSLRRSRTALRAFVGEGLLDTVITYIPPILPLVHPLFTWIPDEPDPRCGSISHAARARWRAAPIPTRVFFATASAVNLFGGRLITEATLLQGVHEAHLTELYLQFVSMRRDNAVDWKRGDVFAGRPTAGQLVPDAILLCSCGCGTIHKAVEFAASYPSSRIRDLHLYCKAKQIPYEIW